MVNHRDHDPVTTFGGWFKPPSLGLLCDVPVLVLRRCVHRRRTGQGDLVNEIDNEYDGRRMVGTKPTLVQKLNAYNEANLARYTAKHFRNEAASDQVAIAQSERNAHTSIGGIIVGSLFTAGLYLPIVLAVYLLGMPFTIGNAKPFFAYKAELLFDTAEQHFVVVEPRSGMKTPILLIPARGAHAYWRPDRADFHRRSHLELWKTGVSRTDRGAQQCLARQHIPSEAQRDGTDWIPPSNHTDARWRCATRVRSCVVGLT